MANKELLKTIRKEIISRIDKRHLSAQAQNELVSLLSFLSSLESEKPINPDEDLNEEIKKFIDEYGYERGGDRLLIAIVARHFAEWQKKMMMDEWLKDRDGCFWDGVEEGKKAMEEQMMKGAVEGEVYLYHSYNRDATAILVDIPKENLGDKVRVIVCKKEDEK